MADSVVGRLIYKITGDLSDIKTSLTNTEKRIKNFSKLVQSAAGLFGVVAAFKSLINIVKGSVNAYLEQEEAATKLAAAMKTSGDYSSVAFKRMEDLAGGLQQVTRYGDDATESAIALLMSLGGMSTKMASEMIPHVQDFAAAMGMDLESAANLVAKAVEGNVGALGRYGISIDKGLDKQGRMAAITEQLEGKFGGLARAMGDTAGGALIRLGNAFGDMQEEVGRATVTSLQPLVAWLAEVATKITGVMKASNDLREALKNQEKGIADTSDELIIANARWAEARQNLDLIEAAAGDEAAQITAMNKATAAGYESVVEWKKALEADILVLRRRANALEGQGQREADAAAATAERTRKAQEYTDKLAAAYGKTEEAQRIALEADIAYWESVLKTAGVSSEKVRAILRELRAEYAKKYPAADSGYYTARMNQLKRLEDAEDSHARVEEQRQEAEEAAAEAIEDEQLDRLQLRNEKLKAYENEAARLNEQRIEDEKSTAEQIAQIRAASWNFASDLLSSLSDLQRANLDRQLIELEAEQQRELEAFEGTEEERAALVKDFEKEKAELEYEAAMNSWKMQLAAAIVSGVRAVISSYQTLGWPLGLVPAGMQAAINTIQLAAIRAAKPVPNFAEGADFTVPAGYPNDSYRMNVESGEHVTVTPAGAGGEPFHIVVNLDGRPIIDTVARASRDRRLLINARSVV